MTRRNRRTVLWIGLAVAAITLFLPAAAQASTNVVPNPGFEQGGCGNTPVLCGWQTFTDADRSVSQDTTNPHTGSASMHVSCAYPTCDLYDGGTVSVSTDPAFCAPIGPGAHQASFWYRDAVGAVSLGAVFYAGPDCTGSSSSTSFSASPVAGGWQQAVGALAAPPGTQSALFSVAVTGGCFGACENDGPCYCGIGASFDDVDVESPGDTTPPAISSFTPTSGPVIGTLVQITGANFTGATSVTFNGTASQDWVAPSATEIEAFVPPGTTSGPVSVTTPFGTATSDGSFTVTAESPVVCCFDPTGGPVGTTVDIMGGNFTGATSVTFNGTADPSFVVNSPTDITAHVPSGATSGPVSVTTPGGTASSGGWFTVTPSPPDTTITSGPSGTVNSTSATFTFTASEPVTFKCSLDGAAFAPCNSPNTYSELGFGSHTFRVEATDTSGNTDPTPAQRTWTVNTPPTTRFSFNCAALTCSFDGSSSSDSDGSIQSYSWSFGDGTNGTGSNPPPHTYAQAASFTVTLTATDNDGGTGTAPQTLTLINLTAQTHKQRGAEKVALSWTGPGGTNFDIYRNGSKIATVSVKNYTDTLQAKGTYTYKVCATAVSICSNQAPMTF